MIEKAFSPIECSSLDISIEPMSLSTPELCYPEQAPLLGTMLIPRTLDKELISELSRLTRDFIEKVEFHLYLSTMTDEPEEVCDNAEFQ